jgi:hypothetical protein
VTNFLAPIGVLLVAEDEHRERRGKEVVVCCCGEGKADGPPPQFEFVEMERVGSVFPRRCAVFPGTHEEIVGQNDQVPDGFPGLGGVGVIGDEVDEALDDRKWDWLNAARGRVGLGVMSKLMLEPEVDGPVAV